LIFQTIKNIDQITYALNIKDLQVYQVAQMQGFKNLSLWRRLNSFVALSGNQVVISAVYYSFKEKQIFHVASPCEP